MEGDNRMDNILLIGGDARSVEVIHTLYKTGYQVHVIGFDNCDFLDHKITQLPIQHTDFSIYDVIILPVNGVATNGEVSCPYSLESFILTKEIVDSTPAHCRIFSGITNDYLKELTANRQLELIFSRNDIAIYNSIPTAEATLQIAMEQTDVTVHDALIAVVGFGRVGSTVAGLFQKVGANVTGFMRSDEDFAKSTVMGIEARHSDQLPEKVEAFSICINTVPKLVLDEKVLSKMNPETLVIDLASKPGGTDFESAEKQGIKAIHALGLPGKVAPKTAGNVLAKIIVKMIE